MKFLSDMRARIQTIPTEGWGGGGGGGGGIASRERFVPGFILGNKWQLVIFMGRSGPPVPTARKQSGQCFFSHQLILQFTEWIQWFYYRGEEGVQLLPGGGVSKETNITCDFPGGGGGGPDPLTPLWISSWGRLTPLFAYRIMVYQNLNKTEKYHPKTTKWKKAISCWSR